MIEEIELSNILFLPCFGHRLEKYETYTDLPLMCSREEFWNTLTVSFYSRNEESLLLTDLMAIALMIVKIIHWNVYPRVGYSVKPYF